MSNSMTIEVNAIGGGRRFTASKIYTADEVTVQEFTVADSVLHSQHTLDIDVSELEAVVIISDQTVLMEWNDDAGTQGSETLIAGVPFIERVTQHHADLLTADVTDLRISNTSGQLATIQVMVCKNNTP